MVRTVETADDRDLCHAVYTCTQATGALHDLTRRFSADPESIALLMRDVMWQRWARAGGITPEGTPGLAAVALVRWALSQKIARDLSFPAERWNGPSQAMDDEARWDTARRLLHDDTLKPEDRFAGLLLLLYAQWPAAILRLTIDHIEETDGAVHIRLGAVPVELPAPVADLALQQVAVRHSHAVLAQTYSPWLFPGGQPGRPISAWAMGERLRKLGIRLAEARSTALFQLATELPAAVLARTLGIDITAAVKWQRAAAGDRAAYAAEISRRTTAEQA
ncbi:hypothetical protein [Streptomyces sp. NPDC020817]|uniref:hypothetical protein n=1 Tax=Streptomyces sp. NPDC020817 TaxID=3365095 RepID=UPI0037900383